MRVFCLAAWAALVPAVARAEAPSLAFKPAGAGLYEFDTGLFHGVLKLDGKYQGLYPLYDNATGAELTRPPGIFSPYRVFTGSTRFGNAARDWPTQTRLLPNGAVEARWAPAPEHPLAIAAVYRWSSPATLDTEWRVRPDHDMRALELFLSTYFTAGFRASVYMRSAGQQNPSFAPVDRGPNERGSYVMFPRDKQAIDVIRNGRWQVPPSPVDWAVRQGLAAPLVIRRDDAQAITAALMCPPGDCFAVASPWNPQTPEARGYRSIYLSLFGRDVKAGQDVTARCRLLLGHKLSDTQVVADYQKYLSPPAAP